MMFLTSTKPLVRLKLKILNEAKKAFAQKYKLATFSIGTVFFPAILILSVPGNIILERESSLLATLLATLSLVFVSALIQYLYYSFKIKGYLNIYYYLDGSIKNQTLSDIIAFKTIDPTLIIFLVPILVNSLSNSRFFLYAAVFLLSLIAQCCLLYLMHYTRRSKFLSCLNLVPKSLLGRFSYFLLFLWYIIVIIFQFKVIYFTHLLMFSLFAVNTRAKLYSSVFLTYLKRISVEKIYITSLTKYSLVFIVLSLTLFAAQTITLTVMLYSYAMIFILVILSWYIPKISLTLAFLLWLLASLSL